jgi:glucosamine 6-phosphate synthetase-like amidotransferase/phosphosugar isomerase protein
VSVYGRHSSRNLHKRLPEATMRRLLEDLTSLPQKMDSILANAKDLEHIAKELFRAQDFLFLARGIDFPIALEGALKLKELSYIHAEGYPSGEMKHGPNALIDENLPVVFLGAYDKNSHNSTTRYEKVLNNVKEVKSRDGIIVSVGLAGDDELAGEFGLLHSHRDRPTNTFADTRSDTAAASGVLHRCSPGMRYRSTSQPCEECYGRMRSGS